MTEKRYRVLTAVGRDRAGLVERVSTMIHREGANLEDSRMAILGGEFALILLLAGSEAELEAIAAASVGLGKELGLDFHFRETVPNPRVAAYRPFSLRASGVDCPGIVARVSAVLARADVNVAALDSRVAFAPLSGTPMFHLSARLQVPVGLGIASLREGLARLSDEENLDLQMDAEPGHG